MKNKKSIGLVISLLSILCITNLAIAQDFSYYVTSNFWIHPEQEKIMEVHPDDHTNIIWLSYSMEPDFSLYIYIANETNYLIDNWKLIGTVDEDCNLWEMSGLKSDEIYYLKFKNVDTIPSYMEVKISVEASDPEPDIIGIDFIPLIAIISLATMIPLIIITRRRKKYI